MRIDAFGKTACWIVVTVLIASSFAPVTLAQGPRNEAVLNQPFKTTGPMPDRGSWVWREKKTGQAPGAGFEGFVAHVRPNADSMKADITIRLYEGPAASGGNLTLAETYNFVLDTSNQVDSRSSSNKKNQTFQFLLKSPLNNAAGTPTSNCKDRIFFITGTGLRTKGTGRNQDRTFRLTTLVINNCTAVENADEGKKPVITPCSDYPDDAVLEEEVYSQSVPYPPTPDPSDAWLTYTWP